MTSLGGNRDVPAFDSPDFDLNDGHVHALMRVRQIRQTIPDYRLEELRPLLVVNLVTCTEWFARAMIKNLIDYAAESINPEATLLREVKLNYSTILRSHVNRFSIGDVVALSRNFSSFDDVKDTLFDLVGEPKGSLFKKLDMSLKKGKLRGKALNATLNSMFRMRHELVHGSPRHLMFEDERAPFITKRQLLAYCTGIEVFIRQFEKFMRSAIPFYADRSTLDMRTSQSTRLATTDLRIGELEKALEKRFDDETVQEFRAAQRAWKAWTRREAEFQTNMWRGGTFRNVARLGELTTLGAQRVRQLEYLLRANENG